MIPTFIATAGSIAQAGINSGAQKKVNRENWQHSKEAAEIGWQKYNSPLAQKNALIAAGFNPNLAANEPSAQAVGVSNSVAPQSAIDFNALAATYQQNKIAKEQTEIQKKVADAEINLKNEQANDAHQAAELKKNDLDTYNDRIGSQLNLQDKQALSIDQSIKESAQRIDNMKVDKQLTEENIKKVGKEIDLLIEQNNLLSRQNKIEARIYTEALIEAMANNAIKQADLEKFTTELQTAIVKGSASQQESNQQWLEAVKRDMMEGHADIADVFRFIALGLLSNPTAVLSALNSIKLPNTIISRFGN